MKKKSFLRNDDSGKKHLKIVISDPDAEDVVLVVSVSSIPQRYRHDDSCELFVGDHPWIKRPSFIACNNYTKLERTKILSENFNGDIILKEDISEELHLRIQEGAKRTKSL